MYCCSAVHSVRRNPLLDGHSGREKQDLKAPNEKGRRGREKKVKEGDVTACEKD